MKPNFEYCHGFKFIIGTADILEQMSLLPAFTPFHPEILAFFHELSKQLIPYGRAYSDIGTFAFWCRRAALEKAKTYYNDLNQRLGRGIVFHSTPSNVPVNFAFSFAAGFLAGNSNIIRLPAKAFPQVNIICDTINNLLAKRYCSLIPYLCMVVYPSSKEVNNLFSKICNTRIIWGGDGTIERMRDSPLKPRSNEITFADRFSFAIIDADSYLHSKNKNKIVKDFYNDTYLFDQNACTSPHLVIWTGLNKSEAKDDFWEKVHKIVKQRYTLTASQVVGKLHATCMVASKYKAKLIQSQDQLIIRISVNHFDEKLLCEFKYHSGFFFEYDALELEEILPLCGSSCQTLIYYGIPVEELWTLIRNHGPQGIDRIVPFGHSMDFSLIWDGVDLIRTLSRKIQF